MSTSQGSNSVRGTWCSEDEAGRHLRSKAGAAGDSLEGQETPSFLPISLRLERIATQAREYPDMAFTTLARHLDEAMLEGAFQRLNPKSAPGVDRVTWRAYKENLEANLNTLPDKLVTETYRPQAVVRRLIPKGGGKLRPSGLPALEDKIVAKAVGSCWSRFMSRISTTFPTVSVLDAARSRPCMRYAKVCWAAGLDR